MKNKSIYILAVSLLVIVIAALAQNPIGNLSPETGVDLPKAPEPASTAVAAATATPTPPR